MITYSDKMIASTTFVNHESAYILHLRTFMWSVGMKKDVKILEYC